MFGSQSYPLIAHPEDYSSFVIRNMVSERSLCWRVWIGTTLHNRMECSEDIQNENTDAMDDGWFSFWITSGIGAHAV